MVSRCTTQTTQDFTGPTNVSYVMPAIFGIIIIKELSGTDRSQLGSNNTLKCEFLFSNESDVEVKWFYNDNVQIVSWIPDKNKPQAIGSFKSILDFGDASLNDTTESVIRFKEVTFDLSGKYTCKVSGNDDEKHETQNMIVYQPASFVEFVEEGDAEYLTCSAYDLYPMPNITITGTYTTGKDEPIPITEEIDNIALTDDNYYNVSKIIVLDKSALNRTVLFTCHIFIPQTVFDEKLNITIQIEGYETTTENIEYPETTTNSATYADTSTAIITSTIKPIQPGYPSGTLPALMLAVPESDPSYLTVLVDPNTLEIRIRRGAPGPSESFY
ncbi:hypothetical protein FQA39_LY05600 [Lamprigera yunnana]|nr:hypothetical protein FQA39_LY05600 [Lamprigera yunnana]